MKIIFLIIYGLALLFIFLYSLIQLHLVILYLKRNKNSDPENVPDADFSPTVTIQLPVYNEKYVVERLIDAVCKIHYPKEKLEIQVLDDSTDDTAEIIASKVHEWRSKGIDIKQVRRQNRSGFKAGALQEGMLQAKGEFIAIFDADFMPTTDFLQKTIPWFSNSKIGVVQTRWEHVNEDYSLLTRLQAFGLDAHFTVEQGGRNNGKHFINFNGTGGVWRKSTIVDAGGWQSDTLTEDLDLSYRAQLKGWDFKYLEVVGSPAELPAEISSLKSQQFRWTKGAAETAKKNLFKVLRSSLPFSTKLHATFHLLNSTIFVCIVIISILSVPVLFIKAASPELKLIFKLASIFLFSLVSLGLFYFVSLKRKEWSMWKTTLYFLINFPLFLSMSMGISLHNAIAVIQAYLGYKTPFIRTPKFDIRNLKDTWKGKAYTSSGLSLLNIVEGILCLYFVFGIIAAFLLDDFGLLPFHLMLAFGYGMVFWLSIVHASGKKIYA